MLLQKFGYEPPAISAICFVFVHRPAVRLAARLRCDGVA